MDARRILVSDLDGTLLGDDGALGRFRAWLDERRDAYRVVYASGRRIESVLGLVDAGTLPAADAVISSVGTEVFDGIGGVWAGWGDAFEDWDAELVRETLRPLRWLEPQPDADQSPRKASYDVWGLSPSDQATIRQKLAEAGLVVELVYSGGRYLDLLPALAGKGRAARFLADGWGIGVEDVLAFGDSGNDAQLLSSGFRGTIVANALPELREAVSRDVYQSPRPFADGVLDGIQHWSNVEVASPVR